MKIKVSETWVGGQKKYGVRAEAECRFAPAPLLNLGG